MTFQNKFFEDEVRDGYFVPGEMKACWVNQLKVLNVIDQICKKHNITYYAEFGTLLGAVRHNGCIPWDDDFDISMKRYDLHRFVKAAKEELPPEYYMLSFRENELPEYWEFIVRIVNHKDLVMDTEFITKNNGFLYTAGIDIFCLDSVPDEEADKDLVHSLATLANEVASIYKNNMENVNTELVEYLLSQIESATGIIIDRSGNVRQQLMVLVDNVFAMYSDTPSEYLAIMANWVNSDGAAKYPARYYDDVIWMPYENTKVPVPIGYNAILKEKYGDYMRLVRSGGGHDYPYYSRQEEIVMDAIKQLPYLYYFNKADLDNKERANGRSLKQQLIAALASFEGINDSISMMLAKGQLQSIPDMLAQCQDGIINIGNTMDAAIEGDSQTVKLLEKYCEELYALYELVTSGEADIVNRGQQLLKQLNDTLEFAVDMAYKELPGKKQIVFIPYKHDTWYAMESVWRKAAADPNNEVHVMPVPYFDKNPWIGSTDMHYEVDMFPDYVPITSFKDYNLEREHPDEIIIQNPFDQANFSLNVHPLFYTSNLKKFTEKLTYIPFFKIDELTPGDERARKMMKFYVTVPGVVNADEVRVQSEAMRTEYINKLVEMAGEETRGIWEKKIIASGFPGDDVQQNLFMESAIPDTWKDLLDNAAGERRKVVLYSNNISTVLENENGVIDKLQSVFTTFEEQQDKVVLLWRPQAGLLDTIAALKPQLWEAYNNLVEDYKASGLGIYDDSNDRQRAVAMADAYYGDAGVLAQLCRKAGKPVMIQDVSIR